MLPKQTAADVESPKRDSFLSKNIEKILRSVCQCVIISFIVTDNCEYLF